MIDAGRKKRPFKFREPQRHSETKMHRMAQLIRQRLLEQARKQAERKEQLANGKDVSRPAAAPAAAGDPVLAKPPEEEAGALQEDEDAHVETLQEELEAMQKKKHLLFVRLKEMLRQEDQRRDKAGEMDLTLQRHAEGEQDQDQAWRCANSPLPVCVCSCRERGREREAERKESRSSQASPESDLRGACVERYHAPARPYSHGAALCVPSCLAACLARSSRATDMRPAWLLALAPRERAPAVWEHGVLSRAGPPRSRPRHHSHTGRSSRTATLYSMCRHGPS